MTRILIQRGSGSSNQSRSGISSSGSRPESQVTSTSLVSPFPRDGEVFDNLKEEQAQNECIECSDDHAIDNPQSEQNECQKDDLSDKESLNDEAGSGNIGLSEVEWAEKSELVPEPVGLGSLDLGRGNPQPPPPPLPPPKPSSLNLNPNSRRSLPGSASSVKVGSPKKTSSRPVVIGRTSPSASRPTSPKSIVECEGYNSADEQSPCVSTFDDLEKERQFEIDIRRVKGFEVRRMLEDGNCLFRAVADQVYGDSEAYDVVRQMCLDYMERERDHFSQFITEGFISYCKRKRRDKVYGNNVEIQALSEMYNRPIHIYSYFTEPINIFHGNYNTDTPPIRLSYHHGNHYNSLVDPRGMTIGAGLGFSSLRGRNVDKDQIKAAIKAQQDQQIDNALVAEGQFYSDLELTEKEIERSVMEASRAEYLARGIRKQHSDKMAYLTAGAEPSSSGARPSGSDTKIQASKEYGLQDFVLSNAVQMILSMGFSYPQAIEAYSLFGDDVDSMVCYLLETSSTGRLKGKAAE